MFRSRKAGVVFISWFFVLLWMFIIFIFSAQTGEESSGISSDLAKVLKIFMQVIFPNIKDESVQWFVRKFAHIIEYAMLSMLMINALRQHIPIKRTRDYYAFIASALYALTDEIHQYFVPLRHASIADVLIDMLGALLGIVLFEQVIQLFRSSNSID